MSFSQGDDAREKLRQAKESADKSAINARDALYGAGASADAAARQGVDEATKAGNSFEKTARNNASQVTETINDWSSSTQHQAKNALNDLSESARRQASQAGQEINNASASAQKSVEQLASEAKGTLRGMAGIEMSRDPTAWVPRYGFTDYVRFFSAGALCATITHGAMTPVDVVKTRLQLEPKGSKLGMGSMARSIIASDGPAGLLAGFGPTAVGYLIQGGSKFCGFEFFKAKFSIMAGSREAAERHRTLIYIGGASAAEFIATTLLTPLEAARIRLVSQRGYATGLTSAVARMAREGGIREFYAGFVPIMFKQIPFTQAQFTINEFMHEFVKNNVEAERIERAGKTGQVSVSLFCGLMAGIGAAIASHPADTLLSRINKGDGGKGSSFQKMITITKEGGFMGLWAGLGPRIVMQAGLICAQMALYDQIKVALGAPAPVTIAKSGAESSH